MSRLSRTRASPAVIAWARKNSGRDIQAIAKRLRLSSGEYNEVEAGTRQLSLAQLRLFSNLVKRPLATFYLSAAPPNVKKPQDYRSSTGSVGREAMLSFRKAARVQELSSAPFNVDSPLFSLRASLRSSPARLADQARNAIGLTHEQQLTFRSSSEFTDWLVSVLGSLGVHVLFHGYSVDDSKAYTLPGNPPVIVINRRDYANSQLFSLVHEVCHLLLRKPGMCDTIGAGGASALETYCNRFASNFIIPSGWITEAIQGYARESLVTDETLGRLARFFSTSRDVVLLKLVQLGEAEPSAYMRYRSRWEADVAARRNKGPGRTSIKANALRDNGGLFVAEIAGAYAANRIGVTDAADLLGINPGYVEDVVGVVGGAG